MWRAKRLSAGHQGRRIHSHDHRAPTAWTVIATYDAEEAGFLEERTKRGSRQLRFGPSLGGQRHIVSSELSVVVFDVNETLSDMAPMAKRFADVGVDEQVAELWFANLLRDGFALAAAGAKEKFGVLGEQALYVLLASVTLNRSLEQAVAHILNGFEALQVHPDVVEGVRALQAVGLRLVTLTNGSTSVADRLLDRAGIRDAFEMLLSVDDAPAWKPAPASYDYAAQKCRTPPEAMLLVAVHPWDIDGAGRAGMRTGWLNRRGTRYPSYFTAPTISTATLTDVAEVVMRAL